MKYSNSITPSLLPKLNDTFKHEFVFTKEQLSTYAEISGDTNPIHVSNEYSRNTEYSKCIVHGYFTVSLFSKIYGTLLYPDGHILISQSAMYIKPMPKHATNIFNQLN